MTCRLIFLGFFVMAMSVHCREVKHASVSSDILHNKPGDWTSSSVSQQGTALYPKAPPTGTLSIHEGHSDEIQKSSNQEDEEIVYTIDYLGATTHPAPAPRHHIP